MRLTLTLFFCGALFGAKLPSGEPAATIDLATTAGVLAVKGQWKYSDARVVETAFRLAGPDGQPGQEKAPTLDIVPHAGGTDFDDGAWAAIAPESLKDRRGNGRLSFAWYRILITVPSKAGD